MSEDDMRATLALCRDRLLHMLERDLLAFCSLASGIPSLQSLDPEDRGYLTPIVVTIRAAETAVGRAEGLPDWLRDAIDTWPKEGHP